MNLWIAIGAVGDDRNDPGDEVIGVFSSEQAALDAASAKWPLTARALPVELDEVPDWAREGT